MPSVVGTVSSSDGVPLRTRRWVSARPPWAGLVIVHGLGEHSGRYERTGSILAAAGIEVHGWDLRGHGASGGRHGWVDRWDRFLDDVDGALGRCRAAVPGRPIVLLGHSLGGLIAVDQATSGRPTADLLVLSAPSLADGLAPWKHALVPLLDPLLPRLPLATGIRARDVTRDPSVAAADAADPLYRQVGTVRLARAGFDAQRVVGARLAGLERMPMPTLVFHGSDDPVVPLAASELFERLEGVTRWVEAGLRHECLNEPEGPSIVEAMVGWLRERVGGTAADEPDAALAPAAALPETALGPV